MSATGTPSIADDAEDVGNGYSEVAMGFDDEHKILPWFENMVSKKQLSRLRCAANVSIVDTTDSQPGAPHSSISLADCWLRTLSRLLKAARCSPAKRPVSQLTDCLLPRVDDSGFRTATCVSASNDVLTTNLTSKDHSNHPTYELSS